MKKAAERTSQVIPLNPARAPSMREHIIARLSHYSSDGPLVVLEGASDEPMLARSTVGASTLRCAVGQDVLVVFAGEKPVIVGVLQQQGQACPCAETAESLLTAVGLPKEVMVDGERVVIRGAREISFECGESSLVMRANGRIVVRGIYVETRARSLNRIRGGSVKIN